MNQEPSQTPSDYMALEFVKFQDMLNLLRAEAESGVRDGDVPEALKEKVLDATFCYELGMKFYSEANTALQAGAFFGATAIAASALESLLLARVLIDEPAVRALPKFQNVKKSYQQDYSLFARSLDLGKLLEIAHALDWLSPEPSEIFLEVIRAYGDEDTSAGVVAFIDGIDDIGNTCAEYVRYYRNLLHPAVCLKERRLPDRSAGLMGVLVLMIAITSLATRKPVPE